MENKNLEERITQLEKENERLKAIQEVQNVMSMHEFYHSANMHKEEVDNIWAHKTPGVALESVQGRWEGLDAITKFYVDDYLKRGKYQLQEMRKQFPEIEDKPENEWIGAQVMHTLTTPIIQVAEDGQTAKGVWVSPGCSTIAADGKLRAIWYFDRYGVDFVKEDGEWKIWHMLICTDFVTPFEKSWVENTLNPSVTFGEPEGEDSPPPTPNAAMLHPYKPYSPFEVAQFAPRPPLPYRTFDETFSY
jgi:hypothetical protein